MEIVYEMKLFHVKLTFINIYMILNLNHCNTILQNLIFVLEIFIINKRIIDANGF